MNKKPLTFPILISLVIGNMIGTGIYLLPASLAQIGTISIFAWIYTGIGALFLALTFCQLNKRYPASGGPSIYVKAAFGSCAGFMTAFIYWLSNLVSIAGIAVSSISYLAFIIPALDATSIHYQSHLVLLIELMAIWLFTIINLVGIEFAGKIQLVLTIIKLTPLFLIITVGLTKLNTINLTHYGNLSNINTPSAIIHAATLTFWAFIGLESATIPAENTEGHRVVAKATLWGTLITTAIYLLSTIVLLGLIKAPILAQSQFPFATAGTLLFGHFSALIIVLCAVISGFSALNVCILIQGQLISAAKRDQFINSKSSDKKTLFQGQLISALLISFFLILTLEPTLLRQFDHIALLASLLTLLTYLAVCLSELKVLWIEKNLSALLKQTDFFVTLLAALYIIWMIDYFSRVYLYSTLLLIGCVMFGYYFFIRQKLSG